MQLSQVLLGSLLCLPVTLSRRTFAQCLPLTGVLVSRDAVVLMCFLQMMLSMRRLSAGGRAASPDVSGLEVLQSTQQAQSCCKGIHSYVDANKLLLKAALVVCYGNRFSLCVTSRNSGAVTKHR